MVDKWVVVGTNSGHICLFPWEDRTGVEVLGGPAE